jgi:predicted TIM-barrel fold metal-dependent hydrolase
VTPRILFDFISSFREVTVILAHFGGGLMFYELMPEVKDVLTNTYYDTAAAPCVKQGRGRKNGSGSTPRQRAPSESNAFRNHG